MSDELPLLEPLTGVRQFLVRSHTVPPAAHTNCYLLGDAQSHRILVDPSPADDTEFERIRVAAQTHGVHEIFITHHHPDHRERADALARWLQVPLGMSTDTRQRIARTAGECFFADLDVNLYQEGDVVCRWQGKPVRVLEVPGHDEGQLALMPECASWCLVGDLIQSVGTVVIAGAEGSMRKYFDSLRRVIALSPGWLLPSHGPALEGPQRLEETLQHRLQREAQVLALSRAGQDENAMLVTMYPGLAPYLQPLARMNIVAHLEKLREEGRLQ